ncbi:TPA: hypothetical protein EYN98_03850 [Candidatus Poribacteria bacterium]|nr:hypothetical protein [Candidatus Poribacteria bacterium]HIC02936.1 hypothetical protein [Candidatus Poribacteria bacterium]HIO06095.1 hypothetical protein [Candidatus Poribacteria bacterium]
MLTSFEKPQTRLFYIDKISRQPDQTMANVDFHDIGSSLNYPVENTIQSTQYDTGTGTVDTETLTNSKDEVSDIHVDSLAYWLRTVMKHKLLSKEEEKKLAKS